MTKKKCDKCGYLFSTRAGNYIRHTKSCDGSYTPYIKSSVRQCKHCKEKFDITDKPKGWMANHSRWCDKNPKRKDYNADSLKAVNAMKEVKKRTGVTNQFTKARLEGKEVPDHPNKGKKIPALQDRRHAQETKEKIRQGALNSTHRRLRKGVVYYKGVMLDSSWELVLAKRLDELEIKWIRPDPIPWVDEEGITHNYFPDFYLPEYDKYLDPKNPHAIKVQEKKLKMLLTQYNNIDIIDSLDKCKQYGA